MFHCYNAQCVSKYITLLLLHFVFRLFLKKISIRNFTIRFMPLPIIDASQALKASPEKTEDALLKVHEELPLVPVF